MSHNVLQHRALLPHVLSGAADSTTGFSLTRLDDLASLAPRWQALEVMASGSFFQSWAWTGCLARERFAEPWLFAAQRDGADVALALFNRRPTLLAPNTLYLGESGEQSWDTLYIEHNGLLCADGHEDVTAPALAWLACKARLVLSGVNDATIEAARQSGAVLRVQQSQPAPYVDLAACPPGEDGLIAHCSANTRQQLRRSARRYAADYGDLRILRADSGEQALVWLEALATLHQSRWTARGKPGAFANPQFRRFHQALITDGFAQGVVDVLRVTAGDHVLGYLYNFCYRGQVLSYQGGFDYGPSDAQRKPGLTAHHLAMALYRDEGATRYDLLAGEAQYKSSLATAAVTLHWGDLTPRWSARGVLTRLRSALPRQ